MGLFWAKYARRIFAIVSTTSIPNLAPASPTEATVDPPSRGSRLDADHPENGVLIPCRFTPHRGAVRREPPAVLVGVLLGNSALVERPLARRQPHRTPL